MKFPKKLCEDTVLEYIRTKTPLSGVPAGVELPPNTDLGDLAIALPLRIAKKLQKNPMEIAQDLAEYLLSNRPELEAVEVAKPGFLNCRFSDRYLIKEMLRIVDADSLELPQIGQDSSILIEFVSANPTGPLHVGHGRGAIYGDVLARLFQAFGYRVEKEYYVNDGGSQIERLGRSLKLRLKEEAGATVDFESELYKGKYLKKLARRPEIDVSMSVEELAKFSKKEILSWIFDSLKKSRIEFDNTVFESEVASRSKIERIIEKLAAVDLVYEKEEALFLKTSSLGDDKDRVLIRGNGEPTYFINDLAYHLNKFDRGYDRMINVWGHDHHGYQQRLLSGMEALGCEKSRLEIKLYQLVDLYRAGEPVKMSTRAGEFVTLDELLEEVGADAVRFNFLTKNHNSPLDFDIDVATSRTEENPVYYVQYAHTRLASILRKAGSDFENSVVGSELSKASHDLVFKTLCFPGFLEDVLKGREPHKITFWLRELASKFHTFYVEHRVINYEDEELTTLRLKLVELLKLTLKTGLNLLDVRAPDKM